MRPTRQSNILSSVALLLLPSLSSAASSVDCQNVLVDGNKYDLSGLKGPLSVHWIESTPLTLTNFTFTLDICRPLKKSNTNDKHFKQCGHGANICGIEYVHYNIEGTDFVEKVVPIAGNFATSSGRTQDATWERLKDSDSHEDSEKDGLRLTMNGGLYDKVDQQALIEFVCDKDKTGLEGMENFDKNFKDSKKEKRRADSDDEDPEDGDDGDNGDDGDDGDDDGDKEDPKKDDPANSLQFVSYKTETRDKKDKDVLRLQWRTKYVCENAESPPPTNSDGSWGFFTWFIIILFLAIAAYLIFGSWLNYNRYGARGWDLLPHGDTIRDLPYLLKDWARRVVGAFQGSGSRGGYSAV